MFMRFVYLAINGEYENAFGHFYKTVVLPKLQKMDGCKMAGLIKSNAERGKFVSLTLWHEKNKQRNMKRVLYLITYPSR